MAYILSMDIGVMNESRTDIERYNRKWREYVQYLESFRDRIPKSALEFATAPWHYNTSDHRSLHDSWVESLVISEPSQGDRHEIRSLEVQIRLLGPYHDGNTKLRYQEVLSYSLNTQGESKYAPRPNVGHGDWLCDEVRLSERSHVLHEIEFRHGSRWVIECRDIEWIWEPCAL